MLIDHYIYYIYYIYMYIYWLYSLLQAAIGGFSSIFPDYQERIARHEAAHFLGMHSSLHASSRCQYLWVL